jgi:predicted CopG family antitoxin
MKTINVTFTDEEYERLIKKKKEHSWHDYILKLIKEV